METPKTLWLYVIKLEQDKYFLYDTYCSNEFEVLVLAQINYDYMKKYKPIDIEEIMILEDHIEILYYLKKYMAKYGIDSVRGRPYTDEYLEDRNVLENEINIGIKSQENQIKENQIKEIITIYGELSTMNIESEINKLKSTVMSYKKDFENFQNLKWINESLLYDIGWIRKLCLKNEEYIYKKSLHNKYRSIIIKLKKLSKIYFSYNDYLNYENIVFLYNPEFLFDFFIYSNDFIPDNRIEPLCDIYELMVSTLINRKMEYKFHVESYGENPEWKIERAIYFLELMSMNTNFQ
jgi:hypothetical protein